MSAVTQAKQGGMTPKEAEDLVYDFEYACIGYERDSNKYDREDRNKYRAQIISALSALQRDGWQPVETAPKDRSWVLGCESQNGMNTKYAPHEVMRWHDGRDEWVNSGYKTVAPIAWMPLPAPFVADEQVAKS